MELQLLTPVTTERLPDAKTTQSQGWLRSSGAPRVSALGKAWLSNVAMDLPNFFRVKE